MRPSVSTKRYGINPEHLTPPRAAYSHAYVVDIDIARFIFVTGQLPIDLEGKVVSRSITDQARFVFSRLVDILTAADSSINDLVKVHIYLVDICDFPAISPIRDEFLSAVRPASTLVEVSALPREGCGIQLDAIAISGLTTCIVSSKDS